MHYPRVLHIITALSIGGAERALYNLLAGGLPNHGEMSVLSLRGKGNIGSQIESLGIPLRTLQMRKGTPSPQSLTRLNRILTEIRPDIIQGWMYHGNLAATFATRMAPGNPALAWNVRHSLHDLREEKFQTRLTIRANRLLSKNADALIYNSHISRNQHESFGFRCPRPEVIPNGFDIAQIKPDPKEYGNVRRELGISKDSLLVGHVARYHPMKDHASFLRAATNVARVDPSVQFLVVGRDVSPDNPNLKSIVPPALIERFIFTGERSDVFRLMQAMDVMTTSSAWGEAFPNVLGEAMASGVPCVATDIGDSREIVGDTGIIVSPKDSDALAHALLTLLRKTPAERTALGLAARQSIEARFSLPQIVNQYAQLYRSLGKPQGSLD